jgi:hypothetical protein
MATGNPLWDVHNKLWALLEDTSNIASLKSAGKHFDDLVSDSPGQRIKFTSATERNPMEAVESSADMPKVAILHATTKPREWPASGSDAWGIQWEVLVRTGDQRFDSVFDLEWAIYRQLTNWRSGTHNLKTSITWNGTNPVKLCDLLSTEASLFDERQNKNMRGWSAKWVGHTDLWFSHTALMT